MSNPKRQKEKKEFKPTWQRSRLHPSNHSSARLIKISLTGSEAETDLEDDVKMASKSGKRPADMDEIREFILSNNTILFERIDKISEKVDKRIDELTTKIAQNDKDIKLLKIEVNSLGKQMDQLEEKCNLEFDVHEKWLIQLEDQNRRSSIRIRNFPELSGEDLRKILLRWFKEVIPDLLINDEDVDRVHRVGVSKSGTSPRDILIKFGNYFKKEQLMKKLRPIVLMKFQDSSVQIYNDLCQQIINWRRSVKPITEKLKKKGVKYSWGYPVFLRFMHAGKQCRVTSLEQGTELLKNLGLDDDATLNQAEGGVEGAGASGK